MKRFPVSASDLLATVIDPYGPMSTQHDSPLAAMRRWVEDGLWPASAPDAATAAAVAAGPATVELTHPELGLVEHLLDARCGGVRLEEPPAQDRPPVEAALLERGILERRGRGVVLAPAYLPTVGVAVCGQRSVGLEAQDAASARSRASVGYVYAGLHVVKIEGIAGGCWQVSRLDQAAGEAGQAVRAAVDALLSGALSELELSMRWRRIVNTDISSEPLRRILLTPAGGGSVAWQEQFSSEVATLTPEQLRTRVDERIRAGAEVDRTALEWTRETAERLAKDPDRRYGGSNLRDALANHVESLVAGGDFKHDERILARSERDRRTLALRYWAGETAPAPRGPALD